MRACSDGATSLENLHVKLKYAKASACADVVLEQRYFEWTKKTLTSMKDAHVVPPKQGIENIKLPRQKRLKGDA